MSFCTNLSFLHTKWITLFLVTAFEWNVGQPTSSHTSHRGWTHHTDDYISSLCIYFVMSVHSNELRISHSLFALHSWLHLFHSKVKQLTLIHVHTLRHIYISHQYHQTSQDRHILLIQSSRKDLRQISSKSADLTLQFTWARMNTTSYSTQRTSPGTPLWYCWLLVLNKN